jgi:hypothetical protein
LPLIPGDIEYVYLGDMPIGVYLPLLVKIAGFSLLDIFLGAHRASVIRLTSAVASEAREEYTVAIIIHFRSCVMKIIVGVASQS